MATSWFGAGLSHHRSRFLSCKLSWMIFLTNSSSPPSAMISVTPPVLTELGGGRREFLELTPCREQHDRQRLTPNPIISYGANKQCCLSDELWSICIQTQWCSNVFFYIKIQAGHKKCGGCERGGGQSRTFASSWLAKNGGLHMQKSYTISVSSFRASINNVFWGTLTTRREILRLNASTIIVPLGFKGQQC